MKIKIICVLVLLSCLLCACDNDYQNSSEVAQSSEFAKPEESEVSEESGIDSSVESSKLTESTESAESEIESSVEEIESSLESSVAEKTVDADIVQFKNHLGEVVLDANDIKSASATYYTVETGEVEVAVSLIFTDDGARKFQTATYVAAKTQNSIGIYVNGELISDPTVSEEYAQTGITGGEALISGDFEDFEQAQELSDLINSAINN